jgi:hypothetical protein
LRDSASRASRIRFPTRTKSKAVEGCLLSG